jgi:hypothetical protein
VQLLLWSMSTCGLGIVTGAPFRKVYLLRERICCPSAVAVGMLVGVLFGKEEMVTRGNLSKDVVSRSGPSGPGPDRVSPMATEPANEVGPADTGFLSDESTTGITQEDNGPAINVLLLSLVASLAFVCGCSQNFQTDSSTYEVAEFGLLLLADTATSSLVRSHCCQ